jgi:hypothetical protein
MEPILPPDQSALTDPSQVSAADASARAAAAAQANAAYNYGNTPEGMDYYANIRQQQALSQVNVAEMANVPLSQIAAKYGTDAADRVQTYYTENPTARSASLTDQYGATRYGSVGSGSTYQYAPTPKNPYPENTAAGIAWLVSRQQGETVSESLARKAAVFSG